ncbi:hypothetical protein MAMC_02050 [Methylacidimicrobium cyclopophantes]|uniref:Uncharacterized protein n=1 Tax=Methylacidimicrobium cyclopophantes TaxID=1041766 RepID=A0A5E6MJG0_9BACT|nr:hypothetical protein [Methylacidimicrobium cyclopophantes]VVM08314.1 hypothetical protein MAMC_02050 [Methylacidimicrobium cyclopophantes]
MKPNDSAQETKGDRPSVQKITPSLTTLLLLSFLSVSLCFLFFPARRKGLELGKVTHAAMGMDGRADLPRELSPSALPHLSAPSSPKGEGSAAIPPPGGVDAFGLPASGAFETGSGRSADHPLSLSNLASYLPIWGYLEGEEVIVGGRVYRPGEQLVIRTPSGLCKARIAQVDRHCLVLQDEEGTEVRVPWPRPSGASGTPSNEIFIDPFSSSER